MRRPLIGAKDFQTSIKQGEQTQGGVIGGLPKRGVVSCVFSQGKKRRMNVKKCCSWKKCVQIKNMEGRCV